jgi:hypothetical protein
LVESVSERLTTPFGDLRSACTDTRQQHGTYIGSIQRARKARVVRRYHTKAAYEALQQLQQLVGADTSQKHLLQYLRLVYQFKPTNNPNKSRYSLQTTKTDVVSLDCLFVGHPDLHCPLL